MASRASNGSIGGWRRAVRRAVIRSGNAILGAAFLLLAFALILALASYHGSDPSPNTAAGGPAENWLGIAGAWTADILLSIGGLSVALIIPVLAIFGLRLLRDMKLGQWRKQLIWLVAAMLCVGGGLATLDNQALSSLPAGRGGVMGMLLGWLAAAGLAYIPDPLAARLATLAIATILILGGLFLGWRALALRPGEFDWLFGRMAVDDDEEADLKYERPAAPTPMPAREARQKSSPAQAPTIINDRPATSEQSGRRNKARQESLDLRDRYQLPGVDLLAPSPKSSGPTIDKAALERNARLLESVLDDFHVKGQIVEVRPGPVVTMYELEPASGIKANRVVQLADDIARNMSALSARVATIPGRSVIGIELPNAKRESVYLSELVASEAFEDMTAQLPIILGKNISGDPVVADLAPMPHLLVAGTTGSGKSVGLNCMILSLQFLQPYS